MLLFEKYHQNRQAFFGHPKCEWVKTKISTLTVNNSRKVMITTQITQAFPNHELLKKQFIPIDK